MKGWRLLAVILTAGLALMAGAGVPAGPGEGFKPGELALPEVAVPLLERAPDLKECSPAGGWAGAARVFGFVNMGTGLPAQQETQVWLGRDGAALYVGFICSLPAGKRPVAALSGRDAAVWQEDSVEVYLALADARDDKAYWQLGVGAGGATWDGRGGSPAWNGEWQSAAGRREGVWWASVRIPFATLGLSEAPPLLRFALARTVVAPQPEGTVLIHAGQRMYFSGVGQMGLLRLAPGTPAVSLTPTGDFPEGDVSISAHALVLPDSKFADSVLAVFDGGGKEVARDAQQPRFDSRSVVHHLRGLPDGRYRLRYTYGRAGAAAAPAYYGGGTADDRSAAERERARTVLLEWPLLVQASVALRPSVKLKDRGRTLLLNVGVRGKAPESPAAVLTAILESRQGERIADLGKVPFRREGMSLEQSLPELAPLSPYQVRVRLLDGERVLAEETAPFATPARPEWAGTREGLPEGVPTPWTPVRLNGRKVDVWGRTYSFRTGPVPDGIMSRGEELLASPCRLALEPAPKSWRLLSSGTEGKGPTTARFRWESVGSPVTYRAETRVEFDGVVRMDVTVPSDAVVSRMAFDLPCRRERARYIHRGPMSWGGLFSAYETPSTPERYAMRQTANSGSFYFLDDFRGIGWYDGMPFAWPLSRPEAAMEMVPGAKEALLRVHYIDDPRVYPVERTFTFGLQAVPVKPMPETEPGLRTWYAYRYGDEDPKRQAAWLSSAEYAPAGNVEMAQGTLEIWAKPDFDPATHAGTERLVDVRHGHWIRFALQREPAGRGISAVVNHWGSALTVRSGIDLKPGTWTHAAAAWDGKSLILYVDGKEAGRVAGNVAGHFRVEPAAIHVGGERVSVDGLRISAKPRTTFDLARPAAPDADTLLCEHFERTGWVNGRKAFLPEKCDAATEGGYLSPDAVTAPGKWGRGLGPMRVPPKSLVQGMAALGVKQMQFHAQYYDRCFAGLHVAEEERFRAGIAAAHAAGLRVLLYLSNSLSTYDPMWHTYADDWLIEPRGTPFRPDFRPDEEGYQACPRSEYFDYFLHRAGRLLDDYGADGFFLDGRTYSRCANERHGCGTRNFDGERVAKSDIWDGRLRAWRMANLIHQRGGHWMLHNSGLRDGPSCFFPDYVWDGEQLMGTKLGERKRLEVVPLASFRALMNGEKFGLPTANLAYAYSPLTPIENCAYSFIHGTTWGPTYRIEEAMVLSPFWKAQDAFGATLANFCGYWYPDPPALSTPNDGVKVSAHVRPGRALVMAASFNEERVSGSVRLNLKALGLKRPSARDAFSGEPVALQGGDRLPVSIAPFRQAWYVLEEAR